MDLEQGFSQPGFVVAAWCVLPFPPLLYSPCQTGLTLNTCDSCGVILSLSKPETRTLFPSRLECFIGGWIITVRRRMLKAGLCSGIAYSRSILHAGKSPNPAKGHAGNAATTVGTKCHRPAPPSNPQQSLGGNLPGYPSTCSPHFWDPQAPFPAPLSNPKRGRGCASPLPGGWRLHTAGRHAVSSG